jgi:dienelactone hydrolase
MPDPASEVKETPMNKFVSAMLFAALTLPAAAQAAETVVMIEGSQRTIPTTITLPDGPGPFPFVVMYHGTGSNRHEAGNGYDLLAPKLAEAGIASARFDFAGNGDSTADYKDYTFSSGITDGEDVIAHMRGLPEIDDARLGLVGWSQGGTIAMLTAAREGDVKSVVTWAGALDMRNAFSELYAEAEKNGFAVMTFDWRPSLNLSLEWFNEARSTDVAAELANYKGAILAIAGDKDTVVPPETTDAIVAAAGGTDKLKSIIAGADHTFNIFSGDMSAFDKLIAETVERFKSTL